MVATLFAALVAAVVAASAFARMFVIVLSPAFVEVYPASKVLYWLEVIKFAAVAVSTAGAKSAMFDGDGVPRGRVKKKLRPPVNNSST